MADHVAPADRPLAIVTGAGSGIGAATARLLAEQGKEVEQASRATARVALSLGEDTTLVLAGCSPPIYRREFLSNS
jgi:NADP-dependent 3-hydroxy acid dehydrogenase YdfG